MCVKFKMTAPQADSVGYVNKSHFTKSLGTFSSAASVLVLGVGESKLLGHL